MNPGDFQFLNLDEVLEIHRDQLDRYGGSDGMRDKGLLESAISSPSARFSGHYLHSNLFEMAAALLFSIVKNHPFIDGNKRTGTAAALVFLQMNGVRIPEDEPTLGDLVLAVANGQATKEQVAAYFRSAANP